MAFLRSSSQREPGPVIRGDGLYLRPPSSRDYAAWARVRAESRAHLTPWEPEWARDELSQAAFRIRLRLYSRDLNDDIGYAFFLFRDHDDALMGGLTLGNVRRGVAQCATLGYWIGAEFAAKGHMSEAVRVAALFAFRTLMLHRLEAACIPANAASIKVLERSSFTREGLARGFLRINGLWQDHVLFARLADDPDRGSGKEGR